MAYWNRYGKLPKLFRNLSHRKLGKDESTITNVIVLSIYDEKRLHVDFLSSLSHESATAYHIYCREKTNFWLVLEEISAIMVSPGNESLG